MSKPAIDIERLSQAQRLALMEELWESLSDGERDVLPLTPDQRDELDRRLVALEREGPNGLSPEEIRDRFKPPSE